MDDKEKFLKSLKKVTERRQGAANLSVPDIESENLAKGALDKEVLKAKGSDIGRDLTEPRTKIAGAAPKIDTIGEALPKTDIKNFKAQMDERNLKQIIKATYKDAIRRNDTQLMGKLQILAKKMGKSGLKALPLVGPAVGLALNPEDASAAIPGLDMAEGVGMAPEAEDMMLAETQARLDYEKSPARLARLEALRKLRQK